MLQRRRGLAPLSLALWRLSPPGAGAAAGAAGDKVQPATPPVLRERRPCPRHWGCGQARLSRGVNGWESIGAPVPWRGREGRRAGGVGTVCRGVERDGLSEKVLAKTGRR